jgi:alanine racemase
MVPSIYDLMKYATNDIAPIIGAAKTGSKNVIIEHLLIDSRKIVFPAASLFFALPGPRRDGHDFIAEVYQRGVRAFVVNDSFDGADFPDAVFLKVENVLTAFQALAAHHRAQFTIPVIGITGSNGKTIVKEWLYQLLSPEYNIVRSPRSYNSQVGVPLSVWQMNEQHTLAIFEAGISVPSEMDKLAAIIKPTLGVLTNIGEAHNEGFLDYAHKFTEKLKLFYNCEAVIARRKEIHVSKEVLQEQLHTKFFTWGVAAGNDFVVNDIKKQQNETHIHIFHSDQELHLVASFTDDASIENVITCCCVMLQMGYKAEVISNRVQQLQPVEMRLQQKKGVNNSYLINDSYSNDPYSLSIALDYLKQQAGKHKTTVILSDFLQSAENKALLYETVAAELQQRNISRLVGIGNDLTLNKKKIGQVFKGKVVCFASPADFLEHFTSHQFKDEYILLKGARVFEFEKISHWLEQKVHQTVLEVNLTALTHNLKVYQEQLRPSTKVMAMVKAFSYGSGSAEVARILQFHKVDYLAVAYADEGVELRKAGISLPIMVMNPDEFSFDTLIEYNLEPEIYAMHILEGFSRYLAQQGLQQYPVHIKIDTGMHRLGFDPAEIDALCTILKTKKALAVRSVFSHLVASEAASHDAFTRHQANCFDEACEKIESALAYPFIKHVANSSAINRHPDLQYDMVRLGIGLYGVDSSAEMQAQLQSVATLRSTISQVKKVAAGETVGYNRRGVVTQDSVIATVRIGYADGLSRQLSNGKGKIWVKGKAAPIIGNVCMDMTMIDITGIPNVLVGDEVEIFGKNIPVQIVAEQANTIAYEVLTGVSQRVKRVYVEE